MNKVQIIIENIHTRRTIKPEQCIPGEIAESDVWKILECANWAPTHGYTEPWRFVVFSGNAKHQFAFDHAGRAVDRESQRRCPLLVVFVGFEDWLPRHHERRFAGRWCV